MNSLETFYKIFPTLSKGTRALFICFIGFYRKYGHLVNPCQKTLAKLIKLSIRQIRRATQKLCELEWIGFLPSHRKSHKYFIDDKLKHLKFDQNGIPIKTAQSGAIRRNNGAISTPKMSAKETQNVPPFNRNLSLDKCFTPPKEEPHFKKEKANHSNDLAIIPHLRRVPGMNLQQMGFLSQRYSQAAMMCALESMESKKRKGENVRSPFGYLCTAALKISNDYGYALRRF